jgi:hypothetical protein
MMVKPCLYLAMIAWCYIFHPNQPGNDKPQVSIDSVIKSIKVCQYTFYSYQFDIALDSSLINNTGAPISVRYPAIVARRVISKDDAALAKKEYEDSADYEYFTGIHKTDKETVAPGERVSQTDIVTILVVKDKGYIKNGNGFVSAGPHVLQVQFGDPEDRLGLNHDPPLIPSTVPIDLRIPDEVPNCS